MKKYDLGNGYYLITKGKDFKIYVIENNILKELEIDYQESMLLEILYWLSEKEEQKIMEIIKQKREEHKNEIRKKKSNIIKH